MTPQQKADLISQLKQQRTDTEAKIRELEEVTQPISPDNAIGRVSRMDAINNRAINQRALSQAIERLSRLDNFLGKADSDEFGICLRCNQPIAIPRLLAIPGTVVCVACASRPS